VVFQAKCGPTELPVANRLSSLADILANAAKLQKYSGCRTKNKTEGENG
jgi:hypothetical protein